MLSEVVLLAALCCTANAFVSYGDATLYDEYDLSLYKSFPLPDCLAASCKVYVSAPEESLPVLEKIYLGDTTLTALARQSNTTTGLKAPYNLKAYSGKNFITNFNWKFATAPVAVYIVYQRATFYSTALVYEPTSTPLTVQWTNSSTLTILSATNFTVKGAVTEGSLARGRVVAGGYDVATRNWAKTPALYEFSPSKTFDFSVSGPLATLYAFNPVEAELTIERGFQETASSRTFLTSPGYTGAISGQVYRSSLYNKSVQYKISYEKATKVHFKAFLNTFADAVEVTADGEKTTLRGTRGLSSYHQLFSLHGKDFVFTFTKSTDLSSFLLRIASEAGLDEVKEKINDKIERVEEKIEEIEERVEEKVEEVKEKIQKKIDEVKEQVKAKIQNKIDEIKEQVKEKIEKKVDEIKKEVQQKVEDKINEEKEKIKDEVEEAKEELKEKLEEQVEEKKEEVEEKIEEAKEKLQDALSKVTARPDSAEVEEIKEELKERVEEVEEEIEEAKEKLQDKIDDVISKVSARPTLGSDVVDDVKDALKKKLEDKIGKATARPSRVRA